MCMASRDTDFSLIAFISAACIAAAAEHREAEAPVTVPFFDAKELTEQVERIERRGRGGRCQGNGLRHYAGGQRACRARGGRHLDTDVADVRAPDKLKFVVVDDAVFYKEARDASKLQVATQGKALRTLLMPEPFPTRLQHILLHVLPWDYCILAY